MKSSSPPPHVSVIQRVRDRDITINEDNLERLKAKFSHIVNSSRAMYYIRTLIDLVNVLELRGIDGRDRDQFTAALVECTKLTESKRSATCEKPVKEQGIPRHVLDMISENIGRKWWDLAHYLNVPDHEIEEIEGKYPFSMKRQAYQVLLTFCNLPDDNEGKASKLIDALARARRYDLKAQVEAEMSNKNSQSKK
ncbi:uncharacterized protein LOC124160526 [Ischnura elegans]|uniref:uncharacterized protein LOC124160526 n=1 Tax=Ischnura elegans TaxID=197161 RepID=UPI001ED87B7D|nr:uncharacterized protein LOC124160526 [Ischnura elegans]